MGGTLVVSPRAGGVACKICRNACRVAETPSPLKPLSKRSRRGAAFFPLPLGEGRNGECSESKWGEGEASLLRHLLASGRRWNLACCQVARMPLLLPSTTPGVAKCASAPHGAGLRADQEEAEHTGCQAARVTSSTMAQSSPTRVAVCPARHFGQGAFCLREAKV